MNIYYLFKFMRLWGIFACITLLFSILVIVSCNNIFKVSNKKIITLFIPLYNLLILLDIVNLNRWNFILLLFPVTNVFIIMIILYRLSIVFHTTKTFAFGLILFPVVYLPALNYSGKLDNRPTEEIEKEELKKETYNLLTEEELSELNKTTEEPKVDNVFKREIDEMPRPSAFKATKIKYDKILKDEEEKPKKIEKVEPVKIEEIEKPKKFVKDLKPNEEDDNIEIIEL